MTKTIRTLSPSEIECRVQTVKETGCSVLLYKDARCDMRILDEIFGPLNWQRKHELVNGNLFCTVSIWDESKKQWIDKQDVGTESNMDKEKGQASDSFKRACVNVGIGRELYTAPFVWITLTSEDIFKQKNGNIGVKVKFKIAEIEYNDNREITKLVIADEKGNVRYKMGEHTSKPTPKQQAKPAPVAEAPPKPTPDQLLAKAKKYKYNNQPLGDMGEDALQAVIEFTEDDKVKSAANYILKTLKGA